MNFGKNSISKPRKSLPTLNKPLCEQISNSRKPTPHNTPPKAASRTPPTGFQQNQKKLNLKRQDSENIATIPENLMLTHENVTKNSQSQKDLDPEHHNCEEKNFNFEGGFKN
jgi:hypothetical protein